MKYLTLIAFLTFCITVNGQDESLKIEISSQGNARTIGDLANLDNSNLSSIAFNLGSGTGNNNSQLRLAAWADSYTGLANYAGYSGVASNNKGLILRASSANSKILFMTSGTDILNNTRMTIDVDGDVGIGTQSPLEKLEISNGKVYLSTQGQGIILRSPNGSCFELTVDNGGSLTSTSITCPN